MGTPLFCDPLIRPIPRQLWPDKYEAAGVDEIEENLGTGGKAFLSELGWAGALGAAPGLIADMWIETWWFALVVLYAIGLAYGRAWYAACTKGGFCTVTYVLMASLTLFLVFQTLEAMLVRFLFMVIPGVVCLGAGPQRNRGHLHPRTHAFNPRTFPDENRGSLAKWPQIISKGRDAAR